MFQNFLQREARIMNLKIQESVTMMSHIQAQSLGKQDHLAKPDRMDAAARGPVGPASNPL